LYLQDNYENAKKLINLYKDVPDFRKTLIQSIADLSARLSDNEEGKLFILSLPFTEQQKQSLRSYFRL
jgi:hypothetical protein